MDPGYNIYPLSEQDDLDQAREDAARLDGFLAARAEADRAKGLGAQLIAMRAELDKRAG